MYSPINLIRIKALDLKPSEKDFRNQIVFKMVAAKNGGLFSGVFLVYIVGSGV